MIKIENVEVMGWEHAIRGMRNPMNSWEKGDSFLCSEKGPMTNEEIEKECGHCPNTDACPFYDDDSHYIIGPNDHKLMMSLAKGGPVHAKYRRMIVVYADITAPLYWWKEFDTYRIGVEKNSCSTMHKIHEKEFTLEDFSCEHLFELGKNAEFEDLPKYDTEYWDAKLLLEMTIKSLNHYRAKFLETKSKPMKDDTKRAELAKKYWWQMIQLLPSSYNQRRTVMMSYEALAAMHKDRKYHKQDEWREGFCPWIETLPYSEIIIGEKEESDE